MAGRVSILGCGWLGFALALRLLDEGWAVRGSTTRAEKLPLLTSTGIDAGLLMLGEPGGQDELPGLVAGCDAVLINIPPGRRRPDVETSHPRELRPLLDALRAEPPKHVIFVSSTSVYGAGQGRVDEDSPTQPTTPSGRALLTAEALFRDGGGWHTTALRLAGLVGGDRHPGRYFSRGAEGVGGDSPVNIIHQDDAVAVCHWVLREGSEAPPVVNGVAPRHPTKREFYGEQARAAELPPPEFAPGDGGENKLVKSRVLGEAGFEFLHPDPLAMEFD